jgi:hypothetical protein
MFYEYYNIKGHQHFTIQITDNFDFVNMLRVSESKNWYMTPILITYLQVNIGADRNIQRTQLNTSFLNIWKFKNILSYVTLIQTYLRQMENASYFGYSKRFCNSLLYPNHTIDGTKVLKSSSVLYLSSW